MDCYRGGQLIWLEGYFENVAFSRGPYLLMQGFSTGVNFTYPGGKFNDAEVAIICFFLQR